MNRINPFSGTLANAATRTRPPDPDPVPYPYRSDRRPDRRGAPCGRCGRLSRVARSSRAGRVRRFLSAALSIPDLYRDQIDRGSGPGPAKTPALCACGDAAFAVLPGPSLETTGGETGGSAGHSPSEFSRARTDCLPPQPNDMAMPEPSPDGPSRCRRPVAAS